MLGVIQDYVIGQIDILLCFELRNISKTVFHLAHLRTWRDLDGYFLSKSGYLHLLHTPETYLSLRTVL